MKLNPSPILGHAEARALLRRALDKAEELRQSGAFFVVDEGGVPLCASRMDGTGPSGMAIVRGKAYFAAAFREPSARLYDRLHSRFFGIYEGYRELARDRIFPGQGAILIRREGAVVGAMATGGSIGPFMKFDGVEPAQLLVEGRPANVEDLIVSYALQAGYQPQHGDDLERWMQNFSFAPQAAAPGRGFADPPRASRQRVLDQALVLADSALAIAAQRGLRISAAVTDRNGDLIQLDRMDYAPPASPDVAHAVAVTAVNFGCSSGEAGARVRADPNLAQLREVARFATLPVPGGAPVRDGGIIAGAIGIAGARPEENESIAEECAAAAAKLRG